MGMDSKSIQIPHKGIDCVSIRLNGKHVCYSCYHHAPMVRAILQDGDDRVPVEQWGIHSNRKGHREFQHQVECCVF